MKISHYSGEYGFWIRFNDFFIVIKNSKRHKLLFSERNGIKKGIRVFNWHIYFNNGH